MFKPITLNILAFLVLCGAAFVFFKNRTKYYEESARTFDFFNKNGSIHVVIDGREVSAEEELNVSEEGLKDAMSLHRGLTAQGALKVSQERLQTAIDNYNDTVAEDEKEQGIIEGLLVEEEDQKELNAGLEKTLRERTDELRFFEDNPDMINEWADKVRIAENSMDEIKVLDKEIKELNTMVSNRETNFANLTDKDNNLKDNISNLKAHILSRTDGRSIEGLQTKVRAVYNSWGFVTLAHGDKTGVVLNSTLDVIREDEVIAKLLVTIVEQNSASADIVPGSIAPDTFLMIGDKVVPAKLNEPGANPENPDAPAPGEPGEAPADKPAGILDLIN